MKRPTPKESAYILRVAGKVPLEVIASHLNRSLSSVRNFCHRRQISLAVPAWRMERFWRDVLDRREAERQRAKT